MAPKRPPKRRQGEDESSPARHAKKHGKKQEPTYDTYDEALDGGVEMEEKGERYRDGDKAHRFYERALELYKKAYGLHQSYDAAYNQARTLYTLSTSFLIPPSSTASLTESIDLYRTAMTLTNSPLLHMDAGFNLAQACSSLAEMMEDLEGEAKVAEVTALRDEARTVLQEVMDGQEEYLRAAASADADSPQEAVEEIEAGAEGDMEVDTADAEGEESKATATYETHLPTPSTLIDSALALVDIYLSIWESTTPSQTPSDESQTQVRLIIDRAAQFSTPGRQAELDLAEIKVLLCLDGIVWDMFKSQATIGSGFDKSLEGATMALGALLTSLDAVPPDEKNVRADILTTLAETHSSIGLRLVSLSVQLPPGPSPLAQSAWFNLGQAITHLTTALNLPTTSSTPKEYKPSVLFSLSKASLSRARLADINETAKRNALQLVENASAYAAQAGESLGWAFVRFTSSNTALPYPRGWDAELLARNVVLQQLRISYYASQTDLIPETSREKYQTGAKGLVAALGKLEVNRRIRKVDIDRWIAEIEDDEGSVSDGERAWWTEVGKGLS